MDLEFHQLDLRYERLRVIRPEAERRLVASLAEIGQQAPIVVVPEPESGRFVVIDGYKRVRALRRLARDTVAAAGWPGSEAEALITTRLMARGESETALEQSWLLAELEERFGLGREELARRFGRSLSWVSRRLALVKDLPEAIQQRVRDGQIVAHAAAKYLVPLARANRQACLELVEGVGSTRLSSRDWGRLYQAWQRGNWVTRARLAAEPLLYLKSCQEAERAPLPEEPVVPDGLRTDLDVLAATTRRAQRRLTRGILRRTPAPEREDLARALRYLVQDFERLAQCFEKELNHAGSGDQGGDPEVAATGT